MGFTHTDEKGNVNMVDIGEKEKTKRIAIAFGKIELSENVISLIKEDKLKKGNVFEVAKIGGIFGAKKTSDIIPLTHPIPIEKISIEFLIKKNDVYCFSLAKTHYKTGIEMEAIFSVLAALSSVYDMVKAVERGAFIKEVSLLYKEGGKSGVFKNPKYRIEILNKEGKRFFIFDDREIFQI